MGNKSLFTSIVKCNEGRVIFGDSATAKICGKSTIDCVDMSNFKYILFRLKSKFNKY